MFRLRTLVDKIHDAYVGDLFPRDGLLDLGKELLLGVWIDHNWLLKQISKKSRGVTTCGDIG